MLLFISLLTNSFAEDLNYRWFWETSPNIEICPDSDITVNKVIESIDYWLEKDIDVNIGSINYVSECDLTKRNVIQIMGDRSVDHDSEHAKTNIKWYFHGSKNENTVYYIKAARVQIPNDNLLMKDIVLHEIGHSLGLGHSNHHIMKSDH